MLIFRWCLPPVVFIAFQQKLKNPIRFDVSDCLKVLEHWGIKYQRHLEWSGLFISGHFYASRGKQPRSGWRTLNKNVSTKKSHLKQIKIH